MKKAASPINGLPAQRMGSQPIDDGHYIFKADEKDAFLSKEPKAAKFMRPFVGAKEFINGGERWILALQDAEPSELRAMPEVMKRVEAVKIYRSGRKVPEAQKLDDRPLEYNHTTLPQKPFLLIPNVSSERREYVPIGYSEPPVIPSNLVTVVQDSTLGQFGLLTSKMHMVWIAKVGGRLENRFRYSAGLVYNTFPLPDGDMDSSKKLESLAQAVLDARAAHPGQTLADLYDPRTMPSDLRRAHEKLDKAVDRLYRKEPFEDDHERLKFLLERYGAMVQKNQKILSDRQLKKKPAEKPRAKKPKDQKLMPEPEAEKKAKARA